MERNNTQSETVSYIHGYTLTAITVKMVCSNYSLNFTYYVFAMETLSKIKKEGLVYMFKRATASMVA